MNYLLNGPYVQDLIRTMTNGATVAHLNMKDVAPYNAGSMQIEQLLAHLLEMSRSLTDEEARHVREHLSALHARFGRGAERADGDAYCALPDRSQV